MWKTTEQQQKNVARMGEKCQNRMENKDSG